MRLIKYLFLVSGMALAQTPPTTVGPAATVGPTAIGIGQIKASAGMSNVTCVMVIVNGYGTCATMSPTVTVSNVNGAPVISAVAVAAALPPIRVTGEAYTATAAQASFVLKNPPVAGTVAAYINGLRYTLGSDYTISGATVTFTTFIPGTNGSDLVVFDYEYQ